MYISTIYVLYMYVSWYRCVPYAHIENVCIYRLVMYRGIDVSQVKYARIENVCIYRRADSTGMCPKLYMCMYISTRR